MSKPTDDRKSVRIIAFSAANEPALKTVNITTSRAVADQMAIKECLQLTAAQTQSPHHPVFMDSGGTKAGLKTIYISGYAGPN